MNPIPPVTLLLSFCVAFGALSQPVAAAGDILGLPPYPGAQTVPMNGKLSTNNVPLQAVVSTTGEDVETVMEFYQRALAQRGLRVVRHMFGSKSGYVGYFDLDTRTIRLATVTSGPGGGTMIVLSSMSPMPLLRGPVEVPDDLPRLPGAHDVTATETTQGSSRSRTVHYRVADMDSRQTKSQLRKAARRLGWRETTDTAPAPVGMGLTLRRGKEICTIRIDPIEGSSTEPPSSSVTMLVIETGR